MPFDHFGCDDCRRRKDAITAAWDFGEFFWNVLANIIGTVVLGLPIAIALMRALNLRTV